MNPFYFLSGLLLLYFIWMIWKTLPLAIFGLNPTRIHYQFVEISAEELATLKVGKYSELLDQLDRLGFQCLGLKVEKPPLWSKRVDEISLANPDKYTFAAVLKDPKRCLYYFYTPFTNGAVLLTAGRGAAFPPFQREDCIQQVSDYDTPKLVLAIHQDQLQRLMATGLVPFRQYTQESRLEATRQYYAAPTIRQKVHQQGMLALANLLFPFLLITVLMFFGLMD